MAITDQEDLHFQLVTDDPFDIERLQNICKQTFTETFGADNTDEDLEKFFCRILCSRRFKDRIEC